MIIIITSATKQQKHISYCPLRGECYICIEGEDYMCSMEHNYRPNFLPVNVEENECVRNFLDSNSFVLKHRRN